MNEEKKINIDVRRLFPDVVRRLSILESLKNSWASVVGPAAKYSFPFDFILNDLYISVLNQQTAQMIQNMKGNITRALEKRYGYHEKINLIIKLGRPAQKLKPAVKKYDMRKSKQAANKNIEVDDELVKKYILECSENLPDDAKFAMSHLRAYLDAIQS